MIIEKNESSYTKRSPFSNFKDEKLSIYPAKESGYLEFDELDKLILVNVNTLLLTTSHLLYENLANMGLENTDQEMLKAKMKRLSDYGFLAKMEFVTPLTRSATKVYTLAHRGQQYIRSIGTKPRLSGYIAGLDATGVKRLLSAEQYIISQKYDITSVTMGGIVSDGESDDCIFRSHGIIRQPIDSIFVESVRSNEGSEEKLLEKLHRMNNTLRNGKRMLVEKSEQMTVVIVCESNQHMTDIRKLLNENQEQYCFEVILTNDVDVHNNSKDCHCYFKRTVRKKKLYNRILELFKQDWEELP